MTACCSSSRQYVDGSNEQHADAVFTSRTPRGRYQQARLLRARVTAGFGANVVVMAESEDDEMEQIEGTRWVQWNQNHLMRALER